MTPGGIPIKYAFSGSYNTETRAPALRGPLSASVEYPSWRQPSYGAKERDIYTMTLSSHWLGLQQDH